MRPKTLMLLALALGCGLVASIGISQMIESRNRNAAAVVENEPVLVASKDIKINEPFGEQNLRFEDWPKDKIPGDAIRDPKEFAGHRAGTLILAGEPLRKAKFDKDKRVDQIPPGYRVVAVGADAVSAIGYLLQPGDRIDVLMYLDTNGRSGVERSITKTILQDIDVFAVNEQYQASDSHNGEVITAKTVSLLVTPEQAEKLTQATEMGKIRLVLRHPDDNQVAETQGTDTIELLTGLSVGNRQKEFQTATAPPKSEGQVGPTPTAADNAEHFFLNMVKGGELSLVDMTRRPDGQWIVAEPKIIVAADPKAAADTATPAAASAPAPAPATPTAPATPISLPKTP
jgi:pilus assembly protein CpaB